jgi:hypothetical protein
VRELLQPCITAAGLTAKEPIIPSKSHLPEVSEKELFGRPFVDLWIPSFQGPVEAQMLSNIRSAAMHQGNLNLLKEQVSPGGNLLSSLPLRLLCSIF